MNNGYLNNAMHFCALKGESPCPHSVLNSYLLKQCVNLAALATISAMARFIN